MKKVAFICVHNSCRSQMAEALGKKLAGDVLECYSAGTETKPQINQDAVRLMKDAAVPAQVGRTDGEDYIEYRVRIPTHAAQTEQGRGVEQPTVGAAR